MARRPEVRYWTQRGSWVDAKGKLRRGGYWTTISGKKYLLAAGPKDEPKGPTFQAATLAFADLMNLDNATRAGDRNPCRTVLEAYMADAERRISKARVRNLDQIFGQFCDSRLADLPAAKLTPLEVSRWLAEMREPRRVQCRTPNGAEFSRSYAWGDSRAAYAIGALKTAFKWAAESGMLTRNPLENLKRPADRTRSRDCLLSDADKERIRQHTRGQFREFVLCLENTGCRPGELLKATAAAWHDELGALVYYGARRRRKGEAGHKTDKKDSDRRIFFSGEALRVMRERVQRFPRGPLWPLPKNPRLDWQEKHIVWAFEALRKRLAIPGLSAYSYRHTYATRYLEAGGSIDDLAALLGNSPEVIRRNYSHVADNPGRLRALAASFSADSEAEGRRVLPFAKKAE